MTLGDLLLKIELLLEQCTEDELHMFLALVDTAHGRDILRQKIAKEIVKKENFSASDVGKQIEKARQLREQAFEFAEYMNKQMGNKNA